MNDKNFDSQSESTHHTRTFKVADDKSAVHDYNKKNIIVGWCGR